ncbi:MAG: hypothetical protein AAB532_02655 [Patescibacteria group bacterium]
MAKKSHKKVKSLSKYQSFKLHGSFPTQKLLLYAVLDLLLGVFLGYVFQPYIASLLTSYAAAATY